MYITFSLPVCMLMDIYTLVFLQQLWVLSHLFAVFGYVLLGIHPQMKQLDTKHLLNIRYGRK